MTADAQLAIAPRTDDAESHASRLLDQVMSNPAVMQAIETKYAEQGNLSALDLVRIAESHGIAIDDSIKQNPVVLSGLFNRLWYENAWHFRLQRVQHNQQNGYAFANRALNRMLGEEGYKQLTGTLLNKHYDDKQFSPQEEQFGRLPTGKPPFMLTAMAEKYILTPRYLDAASFLVDYLAYQEQEFSAIVELGCGTGRNIFDLYLKGAPEHLKYYAGDWSPSAVQMVQALGEGMQGMDLTTFRCDFYDMDASPFRHESAPLIFTYHAIEQVHKLPDDFFDRLAEACPGATGIHFEPFGFQVPQKAGEVSKRHAEFCGRKKWNTNLFEMALNAKERGVIDITHVYKNIGGGDPANPTSVLLWKVL